MSRRRGLLLLAARAVLLLTAQAVAGGQFVALDLHSPGQPAALLPSDAFRPIPWTAEQVQGMRRRALLAQAADSGSSDSAGGGSSLAVCEFNLQTRVVDLRSANFSSVVTLQNNREVSVREGSD